MYHRKTNDLLFSTNSNRFSSSFKWLNFSSVSANTDEFLRLQDLVLDPHQDKDFISLTDIAKYRNDHDANDVIRNWMRGKSTLAFLGLWETINKMVKPGEVTNAAMILFSKENLFYNVHVGRFKTPSFIIDERMIRGNLFDVVDETLRYPTMTFQYQEQVGGFVTELAYTTQKTSTIVPSDTVNGIVNDTVNGTVNEDRLNVILEEIFKNNRVSIDDLAKTINVSRRTLIRDLDKLKKQGRIIRVGSDKTGCWEVS